MSETDDLIEHKIEVDDYTTLVLNIPKVLTPIELKALMVKANKIFNLSEVPMRVESTARSHFSEEQDKQLFKMKTISKNDYETVSKKMGLPVKKLKNRVWYLKNQKKWNTKTLGGK